ncbi:A/G-specific adenine glycosylase [Helicobacter sp.]|uniref:A/G-specific adenine glycosylase n=1 Tax=Helicobacter sp. TaxID=218 RepID=UPI00199A01DD|nr:A/G-specific adenine glycosylase [Helicobacter sp.]MBD5164524.1 A/G-specific adenine glycosylase [Helicobacter sp.]
MDSNLTELKNAQEALLSWYAHYGRHHLPWRDKHVPHRAYRVLVSEIMLQQTQVKAVLERFYFPFLEHFPNLQALSQAKISEVLHLWQGLGYYSRARNLHKLAQICTESQTKQDSKHYSKETSDALPQDIKLLRKLPGIGAYTAGAIACFGYDLPVSFVDSNIKRILLRLFALRSATPSLLESKAKLILNSKDPFNHNQALLDLGALICLPKSPKCEVCPLNPFCLGKQNWQNFTQSKSTRIIKKPLYFGIFIQDSKVALFQSKDKLYFGLYNFPQIPPQMINASQKLGNLKHSYTKYRLDISLFLCPLENLEKLLKSNFSTAFRGSLEFFTRDSLESLPLSSLSLKILKFLHTKGLF